MRGMSLLEIAKTIIKSESYRFVEPLDAGLHLKMLANEFVRVAEQFKELLEDSGKLVDQEMSVSDWRRKWD